MNRRAFLQTLAVGLVGTTFDPEWLLWVPGAKTIFLPSVIAQAAPVTITTSMHVFGEGDIFTIGGDPQTFRVMSVTSSGVYEVKPVIAYSGQKMACRQRTAELK